VGERVLAHLLGVAVALEESPEGVVVAADLSPVDTARFDPARVTAIVTAAGSPVSHVAILARSLGIPAVVGAGDEILAVADGTTLVVDGSEGTVVVEPSPEVLGAYEERAAAERRKAEALANDVHGPAVTLDGEHVEVVANIFSPADAANAVRQGADGVGLLRTEFLFLDRLEPPTEHEQVAAYLAVADMLQGRRLTARTLDIGGDKAVPYLPVTPEPNPFLGRRGLRLSLEQPELFMQQLRALVRTGLQHPVSILFPMVTTIAEVRAARELLARAAAEVGCERGELPVGFEVGVMVEVPGLALRARAVAPLVDLLSIGTNDLTQYTLAAERGNAAVASLADPLDPAVLRLVAEVTQAAGTQTRVAVCGEMASDPEAVRLLIGLGIRELSVSPPAIPAVKHAVRSLSAAEAVTLATAALEQESAADVRALLGAPNAHIGRR
jgi:phosphoenolpyruvate-protein phosphotransferase